MIDVVDLGERNQRLDRDRRGGLLERRERLLGVVGQRRRLEVDRERQHLRSHLGAERRRLLQELLIASSLLLEQALERARLGRRTNLGHWLHLSNKAGCRKRQKFISKMERWSCCATSTSWRWCCGWAASSSAGALVAPSVFGVLQAWNAAEGRVLAGQVFGEVLLRLTWLSYAMGAVMFVTLTLHRLLGARPLKYGVRVGIMGVMLVMMLAMGFYIIPQVNAIQAQVSGPVSALADDGCRAASSSTASTASPTSCFRSPRSAASRSVGGKRGNERSDLRSRISMIW